MKGHFYNKTAFAWSFHLCGFYRLICKETSRRGVSVLFGFNPRTEI